MLGGAGAVVAYLVGANADEGSAYGDSMRQVMPFVFLGAVVVALIGMMLLLRAFLAESGDSRP